MKAKELRAKDPAALKKELDELLRAHFSLVGIATGGEADEQGGGGESEAA